MDPLILHKQLKHNFSDVESMTKELQQWGAEMKRKEEERSKDLGPVESKKKLKKPSGDAKSAKKKTKTPVKKSRDYSAWDKYDAEAECKKLDNDDNESSELSDEVDDDRKEEALYEKEKGNKFVKQQRWDEAIECYTTAIEYYAYDPIFYANRALCYLKKEQYKSAEADCTSALTLDKTYVKAYQRRAAARENLNQLNEAHADLLKVFDYESNNKESRAALAKLEKKIDSLNKKEPVKKPEPQAPKSKFALARQQEKQTSKLVAQATSSGSALKKHKESSKILDQKSEITVPPNETSTEKTASIKSISTTDRIHKDGIEIVHPIKKLPKEASKKPLKRIEIKEINSVSDTANSTQGKTESKPLPEASNKSSKRMEIKEISSTQRKPETSKSTIILDDFKVVERKPNTDNSQEVKIKTDALEKRFEIPRTFVQFTTDWRLIKNQEELRYLYLKQIDPEKIPDIFKESLDCETFGDILHTLAESFTGHKLPVYGYLSKLSQVKRFVMINMFAGAQEKKDMATLFDYMRNQEETSVEDIEKLKNKYGI